MHQEYETIETAFDCGAVEQLEMEVDEIPINNSEIKSDNELMMCPMANDDFIEPKQFDDGIYELFVFFSHYLNLQLK